jgi:hypothetical protein
MNKLATLKVIEVTSQRQADNGTQCFHDPITNVDYLSYETGYIRRAYTRKSYYGNMYRTIYQLNPQRKGIYVSEYNGKEYDCTVRVMVESSEERLDRLAKAVVNYRNYLNS